MPVWRAMTSSDLTGVLLVADHVHPNLPEEASVLAERLSLFPLGCHVLEGRNHEILGYAFSFPIPAGQPPALNQVMTSLPIGPSDYYLHDLALLPQAQGKGYARPIVEKLLALGKCYNSICLISVYETEAFWARFGFQPSRKLKKPLVGYGDTAVFMTHLSKRTMA